MAFCIVTSKGHIKGRHSSSISAVASAGKYLIKKKVFNGSLLFKWEGEGKTEPILMMSHHDVVEATGTWTHEPFSGHIDETGRVWGRGTVDTKASLMCMLSAVVTDGCLLC